MSNPQWRDEILAMSTTELGQRNGEGLLALQLQSALRDEEDTAKRHAAEVASYAKANRGGLAVYWLAYEAARQGRKTLRVADILAAMEAQS